MYNRISSKSRGSVRKHMEIHISACGKFRIKSSNSCIRGIQYNGEETWVGAEGVFKSQLVGKKLVRWNPAYTGNHTTSLGVLSDTEIINEQSEWPIVVSGLRGQDP